MTQLDTPFNKRVHEATTLKQYILIILTSYYNIMVHCHFPIRVTADLHTRAHKYNRIALQDITQILQLGQDDVCTVLIHFHLEMRGSGKRLRPGTCSKLINNVL